ncbi:GNAT family N-acetyltransferase [Trinickia terrae]|uniref:GNAT family N-acetyltransferase n=1 Tax=Trinickia terrae TaxID=2571161 RepID=A0A4U1I814_9BURK|nr:bifunctional helix-turn-helix transcriptional regulator/GNAT family N-acetyltransferase [Trinickia terrae]TKC89584.1 GNAT family N-acetyltransferase [Trinickia terrae]
MTDSTLLKRAEAVRHFNRFYTKHIGVLHESLQNTPFSLTEVRVLRELTRGTASTASEVARNLGLDSGYLSRLLTSFERHGLITRRQSDADARQSLLTLTENGHAAYEPLDAAAVREVCAVLDRLSDARQEQLIAAMQAIEQLIGGDSHVSSIVTLRLPAAGDYGWIVHRQAQLFGLAYGADPAFEAFVAQEVADFARQHNPQREICWIASRARAIVGAAFVAAQSEAIAQLRLLFVEPEARRLGIGTQLVDEALHFARQAGYSRLALSTNGVLNGARRLFERAGFACVAESPERRFGRNLVTQTWECRL